ncbi:oligoendopeptidase F [Alkalibacterium thalassium]|uniref:Oligopeptidase F n=1 Tax=Alkalibacterium thalassium TaxID=426701 RepID=A0A1G9FBA6_9LACT|nr:oligoendopeptidase F [Alkalibacterium thalassium]SDK85598.1 oligopeptidase F. Metallo peptidase. MEROPS family M03B [Alkalibacterium thalassium]
MTTNELRARSEVADDLKWDLSAIFKDDKAYEEAVEKVKQDTAHFIKQVDGKLNDAKSVIEAVEAYEDIRTVMSHIQSYAMLPVTVDISDSEAQIKNRRAANFLADTNAKLSFFKSQLEELSESVLDEVSESQPRFAPFMRLVKLTKKGKLHPKVEEALALLDPVLDSFAEVFEQARLADADFKTFEVNGIEYPLSFVLYEEVYMYDTDKEIRRAAYDAFNHTLSQYKNVVATAYYNHVQHEKTIANMRGYDSIFDYLLADQEVDQALYHRQIDVIMKEFAPVMRKYVTHLKEVHGLERFTYADLKVDLDPDYTAKVSIEESQDLLKQAIAPLGEDYVNLLQRAYPERWIDFAQNKGKESGAFCSAAYGKHPYILMTWTGDLTDAYTLFHELGHAGQSELTNANNSFTGSDPSLYLIEAPSTFNELLLTDYLTKQTNDPRMERNVISLMISKTYFHNFVTHLLEAAYQREVYRLIDEGKSFDADKLSELKRSVLEEFWGDAVEIEAGAELTWMRQIHYYMGLYPYTYSAGLTIATQAYLKMSQGEMKAEQWLEFLALGGQKTPEEAAMVAGVDITTDKPLMDTIKYLDESVDRMIELTQIMEQNR